MSTTRKAATASTSPENTPWYRQFWPWFLIAIPAISMVAGVTMIVLSLGGADQMVIDDYYKRGLAINENLALDEYASARGLGATLQFDLETGEVFVDSLQGDYDWPETLELRLLHPMAQELDQTVTLVRSYSGYRGDLESSPHHRFYVRLSPAASGEDAGLWRLNGEIDFRNETSRALQAR